MPPPLTGATYMNSIVYESEIVNKGFQVKKIPISYARSVNDLGSVKIRKFFVFLSTFFKLVHQLIINRPKLLYFQPSILGATFLRDTVFIVVTKLFGVKMLLHMHGKGIRAAAHKNSLMDFFYQLSFAKQSLVVLSKNQIDDVLFLKPKKIYVVNNGIADLNPIPADEEYAAPKTFNFLFLFNFKRK